MSRSDEPLRLRPPSSQAFRKRAQWVIRFNAVVAGIIAVGWWFGLLASFWTREDESQWLIGLGALGLSLVTWVLNWLARWGRV